VSTSTITPAPPPAVEPARDFLIPCVIDACMGGLPVGVIGLAPAPDGLLWVATSFPLSPLDSKSARHQDAAGAARWVLAAHLEERHRCDIDGLHLQQRAEAAAAEVKRAVCGRQPDDRPGTGECASCGVDLTRAGDRWLDPASSTVCPGEGHPCPDMECARHAAGSRPDCAHCEGAVEVYDEHVPLAPPVTPTPRDWRYPRRPVDRAPRR
jgi:hypothetical protein